MVIKRWERFLGRSPQKSINSIPIDKIVRNPFQPRREFDEKEIKELAQSIENYGIIQPIVVREQGQVYQIVAGERRYRACHQLGFKEIPAIIDNMDDEKAAAVSLIENLQRRELNYFEEASAYSILIHVFGLTQEEVARKVGKSQSAVANKMRLLKIPETVRSLITLDAITERHARALLKLSSPDLQIQALNQIYENELNVKETEELVERLTHSSPQEIKKAGGHSVSMIIKDARIFLNTIKETVKRARQTGVDILMIEREDDGEYEVVIRIAKNPKNVRVVMHR
ncbi:MAG TPA: nucleoid occlusion protein [Syntrophomonadaceae bacterium]|nr:nucleoid occlusion protein [Syntrophomonadaceae bacterium]